MKKFKTLHDAARRRKGEAELEALLPTVKSAAQLKRVADDRALSAIGKCVMRSGFYWKVVEAKWPAMEEVLFGFRPQPVAKLTGLEIAELCADERVIRHHKKLTAIRDNAQLVLDVAAEHGSFGKLLAAWPEDDVVGLWLLLKQRGARLGGRTGPMVLRTLGKDTFLITRDTTAVLIDSGVVEATPTSQKAMRAAEAAFLQWQQESGLPLAHISRIVACSVGR
jgi:3-methyladenine DNA glycosylase Tag